MESYIQTPKPKQRYSINSLRESTDHQSPHETNLCNSTLTEMPDTEITETGVQRTNIFTKS